MPPPYLSRYLYELLNFVPRFESLPVLARIPKNQPASPETRRFSHG
jgi:hypothetical protein